MAARLGVTDILGAGLRHQGAGAKIADCLGLPRLPLADSRFWPGFAPRGSASAAEILSATTLRPSYARWWRDLARATAPAVRHARARQRLARDDSNHASPGIFSD